MRIYFQRIGQWVEQKIEVLPNDTPTLDETLETLSFALISNDIPLPLAPMQLIKAVFSGNPDLPSTYQEVDYIEFSGTQYIDTGVAPGTSIKFELIVSDVTDGTYILTQGNYGLRVYNNNFINFAQNKRYRVQDVRIVSSQKYEVKGTNTSLVVNGKDAVAENDSDTPSGNVILFSQDGLNSRGKLYACKIWNGSTLVRDLVPCYRKSDSVIGLYDTIGHSFFTNDGSDNFTKGSDILQSINYFYIVSDSVETYSLYPLKYKHTLSCIELSRKLSKHLVRNSVFSQPANPTRESFNGIACYPYFSGDSFSIYRRGGGTDINGNSWPLSLEGREKIKDAYIEMDIAVIKTDSDVQSLSYWDNNVKTDADFGNNFSTYWFDSIILKCTKSGEADHYEDITSYSLTGNYRFDIFNQKIICPRIKELADDGWNNFELLFDTANSGTEQGNDYVPMQGTAPKTSFYTKTCGYHLQLKIVAETYYYSAYDVLKLLLDRQKKETSIFSGNTPLFVLPQSGDLYDLLKNTVAPNFTYTQLTMYECVAEVFRLFDAIFTIDVNRNLGITYFNDLSKENITPKLVGRALTHSEDKYTNGLEAYYQDGRVIKTFPGEHQFAPSRSEGLGVAESSDHYFIVSDPIHSVVQTKVMASTGVQGKDANGDVSVLVSGYLEIDITYNIVEKSVWEVLNAGVSIPNTNTLYQLNTLFFTQDDNKIALAETQKSIYGNATYYAFWFTLWSAYNRSRGISDPLYRDTRFGTPDEVGLYWYTIYMQLTYYTSVDGKMRVESLDSKYNGESLVDQSNGAVDLNKMGLNMLGLSLKLGNPTLNATHKISKWADRIKIGDVYSYTTKDINGNTTTSLWVANVVNYTFIAGGLLRGTISFVKNFNALALRTQILREKRMTNISKSLIQKSEEIITEFVYYTADPDDNLNPVIVGGIHYDLTALEDLLVDTFYNRKETISYSFLLNDSQTSSGPVITPYYLPLVVYGAGNTLCFEFTYDHPMSAGNKTVAKTGKWYVNTQYFTENVLYTDKYGFMDSCSVYVHKDENTDYFTRGFPSLGENLTPPTSTNMVDNSFIKIENFKVYKQPNEIFALNYQLAFLPLPNNVNRDFLSNDFLNQNAFTTEGGFKELYFKALNKRTSVLDKFVDQNEVVYSHLASITSTSGSGIITLTVSHSASSSDLEGAIAWVLCREDGTILFSSNLAPTAGTQTIKFGIRKARI